MDIAGGFRFLCLSFPQCAARWRKCTDRFGRGPITAAESSNGVRGRRLEAAFLEIKLQILFF